MRPPCQPASPLRLLMASVTVLLVAGCGAGGHGSGAAGSRSPAAPSVVPPAGTVASGVGAADLPAADVLRRWDAARARAFARGDAVALRRLYVAGSRAGTADARLLRGYVRRGLRIEGMRMQLLGVEVILAETTRLRLRVTDRLVGAVAVDGGTRIPLPRDAASTRVVELRREAPGAPWRVASVRE